MRLSTARHFSRDIKLPANILTSFHVQKPCFIRSPHAQLTRQAATTVTTQSTTAINAEIELLPQLTDGGGGDAGVDRNNGGAATTVETTVEVTAHRN